MLRIQLHRGVHAIRKYSWVLNLKLDKHPYGYISPCRNREELSIFEEDSPHLRIRSYYFHSDILTYSWGRRSKMRVLRRWWRVCFAYGQELVILLSKERRKPSAFDLRSADWVDDHHRPVVHIAIRHIRV